MRINLRKFYYNGRSTWKSKHFQHVSPMMTLPTFKVMRNDILISCSPRWSKCLAICYLWFGKWIYLNITWKHCNLFKFELILHRNLNTIRAIARHHGDPIDRPMYMARYAQECAYRNERFSFIQQIKWFIRRIKFDFHLFKMTLHFWLIRKYIDTLAFLGRSSANSKQILDYRPQNDNNIL